MKAARIIISPDLIKKVLHMPEETAFLEAKFDIDRQCFTFTVTHPELKSVPDGIGIPFVVPYITHTPCSPENFRWDWNQK